MAGDGRSRVLVMMATYNGEKFVRTQIESILAQEQVSVRLLICDDLSTDKTFEVASEYRKAGWPVNVIRNDRRKGVGENFMGMVYEANAEEFDYFAFSDQDDYWLPDKLAKAIAAIEDFAASNTLRSLPVIGTPILYCSDIQDCDENLENPRCELRDLRIDLSKRATPLLRNWFSGCTMVFNPAMLKLLQYVHYKTHYRIHDAWAFLLAFYCGNLVIRRDHHAILRRISGQNVVGALGTDTDLKRASVAHLGNEPKRNCSKIARRLSSDYAEFMCPSDRKMVQSFARYTDSIGGRISWCLSTQYRGLTWKETALMRAKLFAGRY